MNSILCPSLVEQRFQGDSNEEGSFDGAGNLLFQSGCVYEGEFVNGRMEGQGRFQWQDGTQYEGTFQDNELTGNGNYTWYKFQGGKCLKSTTVNRQNGSSYQGQIVRGLRNGQGAFSDGKIQCQGEWKDGKMNGQVAIELMNFFSA
jgi:hypothetical protein